VRLLYAVFVPGIHAALTGVNTNRRAIPRGGAAASDLLATGVALEIHFNLLERQYYGQSNTLSPFTIDQLLGDQAGGLAASVGIAYLSNTKPWRNL